ncbi:MAG: KpsF/GutQ family sugar-phosphate isomerase [Bacteroidetes bacterium]|nr:KpsF/GutQ family sugar-phosphate isomerase [Bacteroidota bacterium]
MAREKIDLVERGREVLAIERAAIDGVAARLDQRFERAVNLLRLAKGKVILTGVGKSGIVAQKITATLNSTGTPAYYMHPNDALHGDLGMARPGDIAVVLSKSGDTPEFTQLVPALARLGVKIIAITGNPASLLGRAAAVVLDCTVEREACPFDLAPTASTTAMLALGDALAVVLYERKGFTREDFAASHPGGTIGRRLLLKLEDIMKVDDAMPTVPASAPFEEVVMEISRKRLGAALVTRGERLLGIVTDGDLRRLLERKADIYTMNAGQMMTASPMTAPPEMLGSAALVLLEENKRTQLPVVSRRGRLLGVVHLHDLIEAGLKP